MNLNQKIQSFLNKHRNTKRRLSATALLSMLITLSVTSSLIMPAISMTMSELTSSAEMENVALYTATPGAPAVIPGTNMLDLMSANAWNVSMSSGGNDFYSADQSSGKQDVVFEPNTSPIDLEVYIDYNFSGDVKSFLEGSGPHLGFDLGNSDLTVIFPGNEGHGIIDDEAYYKNFGDIAGTYVIEGGLVKITLTPEYIEYVKSGTGYLKGSLEFNGMLNSSNDENGDQRFVINGEIITIDFPDKWPTIDKSSWVNESNGTIEWTIEVKNPNYVALADYTLTDDMLKNAVGDVIIEPSTAGRYENGQIVFDSNHADNVTVKYVTKITEDQLKKNEDSLKNHAELKKGDKKVHEDDEKANLWKEPFTVNKKGTADYQMQGGSYNKEINWEITVKNEYGGSLEGYLIEDANIPSSGVEITPSGSLTSEGGKWKLTGTGDASNVTIKYKTEAKVGETNSNTVKLYYPNGDPTNKDGHDDVDYKKKDALIDLKKSAYVNGSNGTIEWTITISNQNGMDLNGYELSDDMLKSSDLVQGSISINPANAASQTSDKVITLTADAKNAQWITVKYATKLNPEQLRSGTATNVAKLKDPDDPDNPKESPVYPPPTITQNPFYIEKTGEPDYKSGTYPTDGSNKIKWQIKVRSDSGVSLENYIINDAKIPIDLSPIKTSSGTLVYVGGQTIDGITYSLNDWQLQGTNDAKYITIDYETLVELTGGIGKENTNDVELKYPDDEPTGKTDTGKVTYKSANDLVGLNKYGNYTQDTHEINWTIDVTVEGGYDITNYTIYDDMFKNVNLEDIQINYQPASNFATLDKSTGILTFTSKPNSDNFKITYKTKVDIKNTDSGTITVNNGYGPGEGTKNATVDVSVRDELKKQLTSSKYEEIVHSGKLVRTLSWKSTITHDGAFANLTYTDKLTPPDNGAHTITAEQIAALRVYGKVSEYDYNRTLLTKGIDYDLVPNANNDGFTITFKNTLDEKGYNFVDIEYQTTATSNKVADDATYPVISEFSNGADFNGKHATDKFTLKREDPEIRTTLNLNIKKTWSNDDTSIRPANAYFKVLYHTGDWQWKSVKFSADGKYLFSGDSGYSSATELVTLGSSDGNGNEWNKTLDYLPRRIRKAAADGSVESDLTYYYKIEEVKSNGDSIENNLLDVNGGSYKVSYNNNNGVSDKPDIYIDATNTFYRETAVTPQKTWSGDTGSGTGIDSITVQLEYSTDGGNHYNPVRKNASGEYVFDQNSTDAIVTQVLTGTENKWIGSSWDNLPNIIPVGNGSAECKYRIREIKYNDTEINGDQFIADGGYYKISYSVDNGNLVVVNDYKANKSVSYTVNKLWNNDTANMDNRPETILVHLKQTGSDGTTKYYNENPVELNAGSSWRYTWSGLPYQSTDDGKIVTYTYTAEEVGYIKDGKTVDITQNYFATTSDGWYNISYDYYGTPNNTTITNTFEPVSTIAITPQKKWVGDSEFADTNRPKDITFKLQRKLEKSNEWQDVPISDADNTPVTVTLNSTNLLENQNEVVWQGAAIGNLPVTIITFDSDGKSTKCSCEYRLVEWKYTPANGNAEVTLSDNENSFKTGNGKYTISNESSSTVINTFEEAIGIEKNAYNGENLIKSIVIDRSSIVGEDGKPVEGSPYIKDIDGKKYVVFNYAINFEKSNNNSVTPVVDKLPKGFTILEDTSQNIKDGVGWGDGSSVKATPEYILKGDGLSNNDHFTDGYYRCPTLLYVGYGLVHCAVKSLSDVLSTDQDSYYYDAESNQIYFNKPNISNDDTVLTACYAIKMEYDEFVSMIGDSNSYSISNVAEKIESKTGTPTGLTTSSTIQIINKAPKDLITKVYAGETRIPGYFKYSIDVNPEGKNLSTGDTIDIQDLLETVSYFDHDKGSGGTTYSNNKRFVDILMDSITLYEVDANGNKVPLPENKYTRIFKNGDQVSDGAALLQLTIPDETHIVIDYTYKMIANETTPSVINGCKSSTRVNGRYAIMQPGFVPPAGDKVTFSNKAELVSDSASDESEVKNTEYEVFKSSGMITTNTLPKIVKVNTGDYTINDLQAKFLLAKYENGQWYYAVKINDENDDDDRVITWGTSGVTGSKVPSNVKLHEINVQTSYAVALGEEVLYKLIEVNVPAGYEGSNLGLTNEQFKELIISYLNTGSIYYNGTDYTSFLNNYVSTYYFSYNSIINERPDDVPLDKIIQIKSGDDLNIPNNELIDIGIKKEWINPVTSTADSEITLELYWSYKKASSLEKLDESELHLANAADLGLIDSSFSAVKTITIEYNENGSVKPNERVWESLPNGKDSKPIYYYVKETGYTIGGKTYTFDEEDGNFKTASGEIGSYRPTYVGNAANSDATINVRNSHQLMLKKSWKNSSNIELKNIPVEKVVVSIYGIDNDGVKTNEPLFENIELSAANKWTFDLTDLITPDMDLSQYKSFVAEESEDQSLADFVVSCVFNLNQDTGEIIVTNKNTVPTEASVKVNKVWSDGKDVHANESIKVSLYQSKTKIDDLSNLELKLKSSATLMPKLDEDGNPVMDSEGNPVHEIATLNAENDWSYTWIGLPLEDENQNKYYYYVLEDKTGIANANKYTESYKVIASTPTKTDYTVTNTRKAIVVQKKWVDEAGDIIPDSELNQDSITLDVLKKVASAPDDGIKLIAFGDSITDGYGQSEPNCSKNGKDYPSQLVNLLKKNEYTIANGDQVWNFNMGDSGWQIGDVNSYSGTFMSKVKNIPSDTNIICFIGGTNDIHQSGSAVKGDPQGVYERFEACLNKIREQAKDATIFVGSIPHFDFWKNGQETDGGKWWNWLTDYSANDGAIPNGLIDQYNAKIKAYAESTPNVYFVDVCKIVKDDYIRADGCHPNEEGYTAIANAFYDAIQSTYNSTAKVGEITLTKENGWIGAFDITDTDTSAEYYIDESNVPPGWQVSYDEDNRYQKLGSATPLVATNTRNIPKTSLNVKKTWANDIGGEANRDAISLALLQSTDLRNWVEYDTPMPTPIKVDNVWTYSYTNLPAQDNAGNRYYYKIEEAPMPGYTTSYGTPSYLTSVNGGNAGTLEVTNTAAVSLKIRKVWSDIDTNNHLKDKVTFRIHRSVKIEGENPRPDFDESSLILEVDKTDVGVTVGNSVSVNANKSITITQSEGSENFFTAACDGKVINISGIAEGSGTITVTDGIDTYEVNVTVSAYKLLLDNGEDFVITAGEQNHKLSVTKGGVSFTDVTYSSSNPDVLTIDADGTITTVDAGNATVSVSTGGNVILTQYITVNLPDSFSISGDTEVAIGDNIQLSVSPAYGSFTWSSSDESIAAVDQNGKVTGVKEGTVTITATRNDGKSIIHKVSVVKGQIGIVEGTNTLRYDIPVEKQKNITSIIVTLEGGYNPSSDGLNVYLNSEGSNNSWVSFNNSNNEITSISYYQGWDNYFKTYNWSGLTFTLTDRDSNDGDISYITFKCNNSSTRVTIKSIEIVNASPASYSLRSASQPQMLYGAGIAAASEPMILSAIEDGSGDWVTLDVTISGGSAEGWETVIQNLDVYDSNGNPYIYWVEEISGADGYEANYQFSDGDPDSSSWINSSMMNENGELVATVRNTKTDTPGYELPNTGGEGVTRYYYTGAALILLSAFAGSNRIRRRLKERRTK